MTGAALPRPVARPVAHRKGTPAPVFVLQLLETIDEGLSAFMREHDAQSRFAECDCRFCRWVIEVQRCIKPGSDWLEKASSSWGGGEVL